MNIEQLNYFIEVIESGSFMIVAEKFFVNVEDIKESIVSLEIELGIKLIEYDGDSKVVLSFEGEQIISIVKEIIQKYHAFVDKIKFSNKDSYINRNMMYEVSLF
ncbi:LysR family transcriptional regulator [Gottfriedia acidiceleris]|uniref:LysR family transcriptional regulator n=1 Tax=Gottfriedia acidiceleris TaxID=371036 RepID=UPI003D23D940